MFTKAKLADLGLPQEKATWMLGASQEIPNLQLLTPAENESKGGQLPASWLVESFPSEVDRAAVQAFHHYADIGERLDTFEEFFIARREKLATVIRSRLGVTG
jgi:hypothetical protein